MTNDRDNQQEDSISHKQQQEQHHQLQQLLSRKQRKMQGKERKRNRIEDAGGQRPRPTNMMDGTTIGGKKKASGSPFLQDHKQRKEPSMPKSKSQKRSTTTNTIQSTKHRFGRVMEQVPCRNKPRYSTLSIALPGSILTNCQTKELRTLLVGQIARAATIYHVDEIIVFDDKLGSDDNQQNHQYSSWREYKRQKQQQSSGQVTNNDSNQQEQVSQQQEQHDDDNNNNNEKQQRFSQSNSQEFMARLLQYCECPQYLRRSFFPMHPDLQFAGLLAPIDAPHHVRAEDRSLFREGVVLDKMATTTTSGNSLVNCGIRNRPVEIDRKITPGVRCTVQLEKASYTKPGQIHGTVVSPSAPRERDGTYWGYTTRMASSISDVFESCPYPSGKYDLKIGTSERGDRSVEDTKFDISSSYQHALIVFGGIAGIEECVDADESIKVSGSQSRTLFDMWLNVCPYQGSRTIRTEEAVMIGLAKLSPFLIKSALDKPLEDDDNEEEGGVVVQDVEFSDDSPSEESSEED